MAYWDEHVVLNYNVNIIILFTIRSINPLTTITSLLLKLVHWFTAKAARKHPPEVFYKKCVLKNFTKFTGKPLCQIHLFYRTPPDDCFG